MRNVATNVREAVVAGSGHWLMEERPVETVALIRGFLDSSPEERLTPAEYEFPPRGNPGTGSSGVAGIQTVVLKGDPDQAGVYTIMLRVPAHTRIAAHSHRDNRVATVISGTWRIGYGDRFDESKLKALPSGSSTQNRRARTILLKQGTNPLLSRSRALDLLPPTMSITVTILAIRKKPTSLSTRSRKVISQMTPYLKRSPSASTIRPHPSIRDRC